MPRCHMLPPALVLDEQLVEALPHQSALPRLVWQAQSAVSAARLQARWRPAVV